MWSVGGITINVLWVRPFIIGDESREGEIEQKMTCVVCTR